MTCDTYSPTFSGISTAKPLHDPTSIIKDEPNGSEDTQIQFNENVEDDDDDEEENFEKNSIKYEEEEIKENNHEEKLEPKDIIVSIKDANEDSTSSSSSEEENDLEYNNGNVDNESEVNDDEPKQNAILQQESVSPKHQINLRPKPVLKRSVSDEMEESEEEEEIGMLSK